MSVLKRYNDVTEQWEPVVVGKQGPSGVVQVTSPITNSGTETEAQLGLDESAIEIAPSQVTGTAIIEGDARLTDARTPTAHTHPQSQVDGLTTGTSGFTALSAGTAGISYQPVSHNYIINGAFDIWQRGTVVTAATANAFLPDRWFYQASGATATMTQEQFTPAELNVIGYGEAQHYLKLAVTTGDDNAGIVQRIENVRTLAGQTARFSFWAKGTNPGAGFLRVRTIQNFGGGSANVETNHQTIVLTASWQRFETTVNVPSISGKTIGSGSGYLQIDIRQDPGDASTAAWELNLWGVQLEAGSVATPFKRHAPSLQGELAACQRYFYRGGAGAVGRVVSTTSARAIVKHPVTMRAAPTVSRNAAFNMTEVNVAGRAVTAVSMGGGGLNPTTDASYLVLDASGGGMTSPNMVFIVEAGQIDFSSEL